MTRKAVALILAVFGGINCTSVAAISWLSIASYQSMWPFPALILIETTMLGILGILVVTQSTRWGQIMRWVIPGCLLTAVVLGMWSIGFFLLPASAAFLISALLLDRESNLSWYEKIISFGAGIGFNLLFILSGQLFY